MSDAVLTVLKFCLLALLYLFLVRVVWTVARELRGTPAPAPAPPPPQAPPATPVPRTRKRGWRLIVVQPDAERGHTYAVDGDATIGRGGGCAVPLTFDTFVSQVHARASDRDGDLWVEDVGSTNGTYVNGERIDKPLKLRKGDRIQVGETVLEASRDR
jgi:FHA domain